MLLVYACYALKCVYVMLLIKETYLLNSDTIQYRLTGDCNNT